MGIFEVLNHQNPATHDNQQALLPSICQHLNYLLNTKRESMAHLAYYGLPDLGEIYRSLPGGLATFSKEVEKVISHYEPRITSVKCTQFQLDSQSGQVTLALDIMTIQQQRSYLTTHLSPNNKMTVSV